jgi:hypothetical protein
MYYIILLLRQAPYLKYFGVFKFSNIHEDVEILF